MKVLAAVKAGMKMIIIPNDNKEDFESLPEKIKGKIIVHYVSNYQDIFEIASHKDE